MKECKGWTVEVRGRCVQLEWHSEDGRVWLSRQLTAGVARTLGLMLQSAAVKASKSAAPREPTKGEG